MTTKPTKPTPARSRSSAPRPRQAAMTFAGGKKPNGGADESIANPTPVNGGPSFTSPVRPGITTQDTHPATGGSHALALGERQAVTAAVAGAGGPGSARTAPVIARATGRFDLMLGIHRYMWLCGHHRKAREDAGWSVKRLGDVDQECDDCRHAVQPDTSGMTFPVPVRVTSEGTESPHEETTP